MLNGQRRCCSKDIMCLICHVTSHVTTCLDGCMNLCMEALTATQHLTKLMAIGLLVEEIQYMQFVT